jgi:hypothetical protein
MILNAMTNLCMAAMYTGGWSVDASSINEIRLAQGGRMSEPVETVCVVTNVTQWNNEPPAIMRDGMAMWNNPAYHPATEKTETTDIIEVKTLRFTWNGEEIAVKRERVLSHNVKRWKLKQDWIEEPAKEQP